ncbi:MAG: hybrid sensor histidine kinase/response regulator [Candidatus Scalindua sp.]|nr:hybrid sensor histidine kinase/response regulator [Candidatus Scalindua sp.]
MSIQIRVLIVEDSEDDIILIVRELKRNGYDVIFEQVDNYNDMKTTLENREWDIVFCDYSMPKFDGISAMKLLQEERSELPFILVSGAIGEDVAVEAMKAGADDYIMKDNLSRLSTAVTRELNEYKERQEFKRMEEALQILVKSTVIKTGEDSFRKIASSIKEWFDTDVAFLGQIIDGDNIKTLSMVIEEDFKCVCRDKMKGTLCELIIKEGFLHYPESACSLLPASCKKCTGKDTEGLVGISILDESGKSIGLLWTASSKKLILPPRAIEVMEIITAKAGSEIKRMWAEEQLHQHNEKLEIQVKERTTRIMELERQRMENEKLAASGRMAAIVAHEINNPLSAIKGGFLLIKDSIPKDNKFYNYVDLIDKEIDRISRIVKQMFDLSKPYQGEISEFNPTLVIRDIIVMLNEFCYEHNVIINFEGHYDVAKITLSEDYFRQALYNIIKNAIEASRDGGIVEVNSRQHNDRFNIIVSDLGEGMSEEIRSKIFEAFFSTKRKDSNSGLGLGLATTKVIVESMGGTINCTSEKDKGTTFIIDLPTNIITQGNSTETVMN